MRRREKYKLDEIANCFFYLPRVPTKPAMHDKPADVGGNNQTSDARQASGRRRKMYNTETIAGSKCANGVTPPRYIMLYLNQSTPSPEED